MPKTKGFTLIELLVVVAIIAILSVIGMTLFGSVQKSARDARRRGDIDAIASALEVAKTATTGYVSLDGTKFASGTVPTDSVNTATGITYCVYVRTNNTAIPGLTTRWTSGTCPSTPAPGNDAAVSWSTWSLMTNAGNVITNWTVCASLEATNNAYCKSSSQ